MGFALNLTWEQLKKQLLRNIYNPDGKLNKGTFWSGVTYSDADRENLQKIRDLITKYGFTESQVADILQTYKGDNIFGGQMSGGNDPVLTLLQDLQEMDSWADEIGDAPTIPNAEDYYQDALDQINSEDAELNAIYDEIFNDQSNFLQKSLENNNEMFGDYRNQILTNNAMQQQAIAGSTRFELDRQQRMAISRGASAAQRLVGSINASLGTQAQSAQQALDTSNALAQNLLTHRQANQSVRNSYMQAKESDSLRRADLIRGRTERIMGAQNMRLGQAMDAYDLQNQDYNNRLSNIQGTNPWSSAWTSWYTKNQNNKTRNAI